MVVAYTSFILWWNGIRFSESFERRVGRHGTATAALAERTTDPDRAARWRPGTVIMGFSVY